MYTPVNPSFFYIKVGCKGVYITRTCYPDAELQVLPVYSIVRRVLLCAVSSLCLAETGLLCHFIATHLEPSFDEDVPYSKCQKTIYGRPRECHNKITQPILSTKRKGKPLRTEVRYM